VLAIYLYREGERIRQITSEKREIWMGTDPRGDIVLTSGKPRHCKLVVRAAGCFLVREEGPVLVNGKPIDRATPLYETDKVFVAGLYQFMIAMLARAPDANEEKLLAEIAAGDDDSRLVYADWLEENGDIRRAEYLRCQEVIRTLDIDDRVAFAEHSRRLRTLTTLVDIGWRMKVARAPVENCKVDAGCVKQWSELAETGNSDVRRCDLCGRDVHYCTSMHEARDHAWRGRCVAVDASTERTKDDLVLQARDGWMRRPD
jgi:uncharacterized protein (TIGR02996 family)